MVNGHQVQKMNETLQFKGQACGNDCHPDFHALDQLLEVVL